MPRARETLHVALVFVLIFLSWFRRGVGFRRLRFWLFSFWRLGFFVFLRGPLAGFIADKSFVFPVLGDDLSIEAVFAAEVFAFLYFLFTGFVDCDSGFIRRERPAVIGRVLCLNSERILEMGGLAGF